jgi:hypothetical protein
MKRNAHPLQTSALFPIILVFNVRLPESTVFYVIHAFKLLNDEKKFVIIRIFFRYKETFLNVHFKGPAKKFVMIIDIF